MKPISEEKRFMIRPAGLMSKNSIFALKTDVVILWCNSLDAFVIHATNVRILTVEIKMIESPNPNARTEISFQDFYGN